MTQPPKLAKRLLLLFLRDDLQEEVLGDLDEKFYSEKSQRRARFNYWYQVFSYLRPFAMRKKRYHPLTHIDMLKNYLTVAWRNLLKHPMYSTINIGGFAFGIAACALLAVYIHGELSYDKHYVNGDRIYRVIGHGIWDGQEYPGLHFSHPFGDVLKESFPEIEEVGYYNSVVNFGAGSNEVRRTDRAENTHEEKLVYFNQGLLDVLELQFIHGNPSKALTDPRTVVITGSTAIRYFGDEDPVGKSIILNDDPNKVYAITGVVKDFHAYSHLNFDFMLTANEDIGFAGERTSWCCNNYINYVRLRSGVDPKDFGDKIAPLVRTYTLADAKKRNAVADEQSWINSFHYSLQPLSRTYLNTEGYHDDLNHGDIRFIWLFGSIAVFILFLACINFINLSTARSANRAKEVGIRKAIGSLRSWVVRQFLAESFMFSLIALVIGLMLAQLMIPFFNNLVGKSLSFPWTQWWLIPSLLAAAILIGFIAGIYPAFYLSAFMPAKVLKGGLATGARNSSVRSVLVIFQFTISIVLIVGTIVIGRQMTYALNKDLGFDKNDVMVLHGTVTLGDKNVPFKNELMKLSQVKSVSISNYLPVDDGKRDGGTTTIEGKEGELHSQQWEVDTDYVKTMGFKVIRGRDFDSRLISDSAAMIINESMAKQFGETDPIGLRVANYSGKYTIVGIVEDFHFHTLTQQIAPVSMFTTKRRANIITIKIQPGDNQSAIEAVSATWKQFSPNQPVRYEFLDDRYVNTYNDVKRFDTIVKVFAALAIIVACLGLFALSAFMIEQRGKEISIRMVLGAPMAHILRLLSQNFVMLVSISFLIATPIAWYMTNQWLQDYAYKIEVTWDIFAITGTAALLIALVTIGYQSIKASVTNPIVNLKSE
jgi:putative ABC transport system permease protein